MFDQSHYLLGSKKQEAPRKNFRRRLWDVRKGSGREGDRVAETARPGCQLREQNPSQHVHAHLFRRIRKWRRWVFRECLVSSWKMETSLLLCFPLSHTEPLCLSHTETASRLIHLHATRTFSDTSFLRDQTRKTDQTSELCACQWVQTWRHEFYPFLCILMFVNVCIENKTCVITRI